jgi:hypothetical protein
VGGEFVARHRETLRAAAITHVINCVGYLYTSTFAEELAYLTLFLQGVLLTRDRRALTGCLGFGV